MPIKGLSDRGLSFPEIGQLRKGAPKTGNRPGADLAYFRVAFDEKETKAQEDFLAVYGAQPTAIRIILPFNEIERQWEAWYEAYTAGRMVARADGEYFVYLVDTQTGELLVKNGLSVKNGEPVTCNVDIPVGYYTTQAGKRESIKLKACGRLKVIIPELARAAYLTVLTTSIHDILNISDQLRAFQTLNGGRIAGIPLVLRRRPKAISTPNPDGTRARRVKSLLSIEADPEWVRAALSETQRLALPGGGHLAALPAGKLEQPLVEDPEPGESYEPDEDEQDGVEDGHYTIPEPEAPAEPEPAPEPAPAAPAEANGNARPYNPAVLKSKLANAATNYQSHLAPTEKQISLVAMLIASAFAGESDHDMRRHAVQGYLFGAASLKDASGPLILAALNNWLKPAQDTGGEYKADPMALREIQLAYTASLVAQGQQALL